MNIVVVESNLRIFLGAQGWTTLRSRRLGCLGLAIKDLSLFDSNIPAFVGLLCLLKGPSIPLGELGGYLQVLTLCC